MVLARSEEPCTRQWLRIVRHVCWLSSLVTGLVSLAVGHFPFTTHPSLPTLWRLSEGEH